MTAKDYYEKGILYLLNIGSHLESGKYDQLKVSLAWFKRVMFVKTEKTVVTNGAARCNGVMLC